MFERPDGEWEIIHFAESEPPDEYVYEVDRGRVRDFLRHFVSDRTVMSALRRLLNRFIPVGRYTDEDVIDVVVARLVARHLLLRRHRRNWDSAGGGGAASGRQQSSSESSGPAVSSPKAPEPEADTFSNNDGKAQAAALAAAAAAGVPFCEECARQDN